MSFTQKNEERMIPCPFAGNLSVLHKICEFSYLNINIISRIWYYFKCTLSFEFSIYIYKCIDLMH